MDQSSRDDTLMGVRSAPIPGRGAVSRQSSRDKRRKHSLPGSVVREEGRAISDGPVVVLVGPPGALVAEAGRLLAERLGAPLRDTDEDVAAAAGKAVADVFVDDGEETFRELERVAVDSALEAAGAVVVLGSGAVMDPLVEEALRGRRVAFLDVDVAPAARRLGFSGQRPVGLGNPRAQWLRLMERRRPVYERVATVTVDTDDLTPEEIAGRVAARLDAPEPKG
jgi:shikimate kinase